MGNQAYVI